MTEHEFKTRCNNQRLSFKDRKHWHDTVLSKHIWDLKDGDIDYEINWPIIKKASAYKGNPSRCNIYVAEKNCILTAQSFMSHVWRIWRRKTPRSLVERDETFKRQESFLRWSPQSHERQGSTLRTYLHMNWRTPLIKDSSSLLKSIVCLAPMLVWHWKKSPGVPWSIWRTCLENTIFHYFYIVWPWKYS